MALKGNVTIYRLEPDTDNPETNTYTTPEGVVESKEFYPMKEVAAETLTNAYVIVRAAAIHLEDYTRFAQNIDSDGNVTEEEISTPRGETKAGYRLNIRYHVYTSEENRLDRWGHPHLEIDEDEWILIDNLSLGGKNLIEYCYDWLKTKRGFESLTSD
jgi:hypothetical protein